MTAVQGIREYDVCLSFAGEQRSYVELVARLLRNSGIRVFYDDYEKVSLWGKDLYEHLDWIYRHAAIYCIAFISEDYAKKVWTNHERRSAQARALEENSEYLLPVRFDETEVPGLRSTVAYIDGTRTSATELSELVIDKLGRKKRSNFLPSIPDLLYKGLGVQRKPQKEAVRQVALSFMNTLQRMNLQERYIVGEIYVLGCTSDLPKNVHVGVETICHSQKVTPARLVEILKGLAPIGVDVQVRSGYRTHEGEVVVLSWTDRSAYDVPATFHYASRYSNLVAERMLGICAECACEGHFERIIEQLDFIMLSSARDFHSH